VTLWIEEESLEVKCIPIIAMENSLWILIDFVGVWFYLKYEKRQKDNSYQYYIEFVIFFSFSFFKIRFICHSLFGIKITFCQYWTVVAIGGQQQRGKLNIEV